MRAMRRRQYVAMAMRSTKSSSTAPSGLGRGGGARRGPRGRWGRSRRSGGSSPGRMGDLLVSPWTVLLRLERALPSAVRGRWISALCAAIVSAGTTQAGIFAPGRNVQSRRHLAPGESFGFGRQVVDMGSIEGDLTEPGAEGVDVHPGLQEG